jgi:hypothetical protein
MATIPNPRSYQQIVGDMFDAFLSKVEQLTTLKVGSPPLAMIEAAAQSDLRTSQDIFQMLASIRLDKAQGIALDRIGADENLPRQQQTLASGSVTVGDSSITKIATKLYLGEAAPIVGSDKLYVVDATDFPDSGSIYIGRGTTNYEGPLDYTSKLQIGVNYWRLSLAVASHTQKFHNHGETVVLAQGGNRSIPAGTVVQTPQANVSSAVKFSTLYSAVLPDGETEITGITVVAQKAGTGGNVPAGVINAFATDPFTGATVTNPLPFTNALANEKDDPYRERIKNKRQSRSLGTPLAIRTAVVGITSADENRRVNSASVVTRRGLGTTLYIDDGTGYEESSLGVATETLTDSAYGGEQDFQVTQRPITKAFVQTLLSAPFFLTSGMVLAVRVGGVLSKHTFDADEFRIIGNAGADEVVASINGNSELPFQARTAANNTKVILTAKVETDEDIEVTSVDTDEVDANSVLGFPLGRVDTLRLYRNDVLLSKDGRKAVVSSEAQNTWAVTSGDQTLTLSIDGTPATTYTITDSDFVSAATGYSSLNSSNSLAAWAKVFEAKIPGISCAVEGSKLVLTSNLGASRRASISISGGSLVTSTRMFTFNTGAALIATGKDNDFTVDRNTGQIRLASVLAEGDRLDLGSLNTRAFIESDELAATTLLATAELWFVIDGAPSVITTGLIGGSTVNIDSDQPTQSWGERIRITAGSGTPFFNNIARGDWAIFMDTAFHAGLRGAFRIAFVDGLGTYFEVEKSANFQQFDVELNGGGIVFVRTSAQVQKVSIAAASNYTAASFATEINADLKGATAETYRTNRLRIRTNSFDSGGDIALVAANTEGLKLKLPLGEVTNLTSHLAVVESGNAEAGTPGFNTLSISAVTSGTVFTASGLGSNQFARFLPNAPDIISGGGYARYGTNAQRHFVLDNVNGSTVTTRDAALQEFIVSDRFYAAAPYALSGNDSLTVVVDGDTASHRYAMNMYRRVKPTTSTYGLTNSFTDTDNGNQSLAMAFGLGFDFLDFAAYMKARTRSHNESGTGTKTILWRFNRFGPDGNAVRLRYVYPVAASQPLAITSKVDAVGYEANTLVEVALPSGALSQMFTTRATSRIGVMAKNTGSLQTLYFIYGYAISSALRYVKLDYTGRGTTAFSGTVTGGTSGATGTVVSDSLAGGSSGAGTLTLSAVTGTFAAGEALTGTAGAGTSSGGQTGETRLTLTLPNVDFTDHGLVNGDQVWVQSNSGSFSSGVKVLTKISSTVVAYTEGTTSVGATASIGTVSVDTSGEIVQTAGGVDYIFNSLNVTALPSTAKTAGRIQTYNTQWASVIAQTAHTTGTVPSFYAGGNSVLVYPLTNATASSIVTAVNALPSSPVSAALSGDGTGIVSRASWDEFTSATKVYTFADGINFVRSQVNPVSTGNHYVLTFKDGIAGDLATNSDWSNEEVRLVPITAKSVKDYLNCLGVSGLSSGAEVSVSERAAKIQIASLTAGSGGSVEVQGGTANSASASVLDSARVVGSYSIVTTKAADVQPLTAGMWVEIQNINTMPKELFTGSTSCLSITTDGVFTIAGTQVRTYAAPMGSYLGNWQVEKHGRYTAFVFDGNGTPPDMSGAQEGDWVEIDNASATLSSANAGIFRIVRVDSTLKTFWIENSKSVEEYESATVSMWTYDSMMPGDTVNISTTLWGAGNVGIWVVETVTSTDTFKVKTIDKATSLFLGPQTLGGDAALVQCQEGTPTKLVKKILAITDDPANSEQAVVKFSTSAGYKKLSVAAGSIITALDKLAFPTDVATGIDGYSHSTGLIGEAARVIYGDERDPATYPGVVAAGASVNISGPLVKRVKVALALRVRSGVSSADVFDRVKSTVASTVNSIGIGQPIAISDIVAAAKSVNGVVAVAVISPTYGVGNDLISVQPYEKPLVLDLENDVSVTLAGG